MRKAQVIRGNQLKFETGHTKDDPLMIRRGIGAKTVEKPNLKMIRTVVPPGVRNQRHYHVNCDVGMYMLKGRLRMFFGPNHELEEDIAEGGDFVFIPAGVIHGLMNLSDTQPAEFLSTKNNVSDLSEEGTVIVEPPWTR